MPFTQFCCAVVVDMPEMPMPAGCRCKCPWNWIFCKILNSKRVRLKIVEMSNNWAPMQT